MVTIEDLKRPVGRLREQLAIFEEKVRKMEAEKQAAETRAGNAEKRVRIHPITGIILIHAVVLFCSLFCNVSSF